VSDVTEQWLDQRGLRCESAPIDHNETAIYAITMQWVACGHQYQVRSMLCVEHGAQVRARPEASRATTCETCGRRSRLRLTRIEDVRLLGVPVDESAVTWHPGALYRVAHERVAAGGEWLAVHHWRANLWMVERLDRPERATHVIPVPVTLIDRGASW
jgi:hypothetical protein